MITTIFDEEKYHIIGERTKIYRLGDTVRIRVIDADVVRRNIDLNWSSGLTPFYISVKLNTEKYRMVIDMKRWHQNCSNK